MDGPSPIVTAACDATELNAHFTVLAIVLAALSKTQMSLDQANSRFERVSSGTRQQKSWAGFVLALFSGWGLAFGAEVEPPPQDYYLQLRQIPHQGNEGVFFSRENNEIAWVETAGDLIVTDALSFEAWIRWDNNDFEEIQAVSGLDTDRSTLFCAQRAYGFQYRFGGVGGWSFFLATDNGVADSPPIPIPRATWAHFAATYDGASIRTYVDGVLQTEAAHIGIVLNPSTAYQSECTYTWQLPENEQEPTNIFALAPGQGFSGGVRQLRIWNRALSEVEILSGVSTHLQGDEPGLVAYWPLDGPRTSLEAPNQVSGGAPLLLGWEFDPQRPNWELTEPLYEVREDLAEDILLSDCASMSQDQNTWWLVDVQNDADKDLIFSGISGQLCHGSAHTAFHALIRDGANGFVFDTPAAIAGGVVLAHDSFRSASADFNGDGRGDIFSANIGNDYCNGEVGAPNTLLLSRPDGRLEDASANLLSAPCDAMSPQFKGQHNCMFEGGAWGRPPGPLYPGEGGLVSPRPGFTHGVATGDIDGDDDVDILVGNYAAGGIEAAYMMINDGTGVFEADWELLPDFMYITDDGTQPLGFLLADLDGDNHVDLVTSPAANEFGTQNWHGGIYWNDGSGDFSAADHFIIEPTPGIPNSPNHPLPHSSGAMEVVDIDMDGDQDLLVSWDSADIQDPTERTSLQILINHGNRSFVDETVARIGTPPQAGMPAKWVIEMISLDLNEDNCPDLLFTDSHLQIGDVGIWINNCEGVLVPPTRPVLPKGDSTFIPMDYDNDGDIDLISVRSRVVNYATTAGCQPGEGEGADYMDFSVLLNVNPTGINDEILNEGFED